MKRILLDGFIFEDFMLSSTAVQEKFSVDTGCPGAKAIIDAYLHRISINSNAKLVNFYHNFNTST